VSRCTNRDRDKGAKLKCRSKRKEKGEEEEERRSSATWPAASHECRGRDKKRQGKKKERGYFHRPAFVSSPLCQQGRERGVNE